jgi:hypothetical protein
MTLTLFAWLMASWTISFIVAISSVVVLVGGFLLKMSFETAMQGYIDMTPTPNTGSPFTWFPVVYLVLSLSSYALAATLIAGYCHRNFNRLAGRADPLWSSYYDRPVQRIPAEATVVT